MGPKCTCPYKMKVDTREREDNTIAEEGLDVATNQGLPAAVNKSWKRQVPNSPLQPLAGAASILTSAQWYRFQISGLQNYKRKNYFVLSHWVCDNLLL